ncbi:baseplate J/gp47 family protein [Novosphingobium sp. 9]|uniref:baseplate assembly protein n=1 Tax=Novosphingobium sp. 9 TaxID=2025349 RepID=UPI0021B68017|nr:baseplate J/gp47 family protein [Novosphingobium sp. 9]
MVTSTASSAAVDLSTLPAPVLVAQPDFATRFAGKLATFLAQDETFTALLESDPAYALLEADSYDEVVLAQACNDAAKGMLLAFATGPNLDHLGALMDVPRLTITAATDTADAVMEGDTAYKRRIQLAPHSFSVAGPELAYVFHALSAHADVLDATAVSPSPGEVVVTVMSRSGNGVPSADVIAAVDAKLQGAVRPLTDFVTVQAAEPVDYTIEAQLYVFAGPDQSLILETAQAALTAHVADVRKLDRDIARSAEVAALHVGNVQRVVLLDNTDIPISAGQFGNATSISVTIAGTEL